MEFVTRDPTAQFGVGGFISETDGIELVKAGRAVIAGYMVRSRNPE